MLDRGEDDLAVANVFDVVKQVLTRTEVEVPGFSWLVGHLPRGAIEGVLAASSCCDGRPEVVQNVPVRVPALSWGKPDLPDTNPVVFAQKSGSNIAIKGVLFEFAAKVVGPPFKVGADKVAGEGRSERNRVSVMRSAPLSGDP